MKYLLIPAAGHFDEDEGLTLQEHAEQIADDLGMVLVPDDSLREDGFRYRMAMYMATHKDAPEAQYMNELVSELSEAMPLEQQVVFIKQCIDKVRAKFGDRHE